MQKSSMKYILRRSPLEGRGWGCLGPPRTVSSAPSSARTGTSWTPRRRLTQSTATFDSPRCSPRCCPWCLVRPASLSGGCRGVASVYCPRAEDEAGGWPTESQLDCTWRMRRTRTHAGVEAPGTGDSLPGHNLQPSRIYMFIYFFGLNVHITRIREMRIM